MLQNSERGRLVRAAQNHIVLKGIARITESFEAIMALSQTIYLPWYDYSVFAYNHLGLTFTSCT